MAQFITWDAPRPLDIVGTVGRGVKLGQEQYDRDTLFEVGKAALMGDMGAAKKTAFGRGDLKTGFDIEDRGLKAKDRQMAIEDRDLKRLVGLGQVIDDEPDDAKASGLWQRVVKGSPDVASRLARYGIDPRDHRAGARALMAMGGQYKSNLDRRMDEAKIKSLESKDWQGEFMRDLMKPDGAPQAAPAGRPQVPGQPQLQPQSFDGDGGDPMLIPTQAGGPAPQQPAAPEMVQTPAGPMTPERARKLGLGLALMGKGEAGKMIADPANAEKLGKEAGNENDKREIGMTDAVGRLRDIKSQFDPKHQKSGTQFGVWLSQAGEKIGAPISPEAQADMASFVRHRSTALNHFNMTLKQLSGTAVSQQEFDRVKAELPNPGSGVFNGAFDGDSPTTFAAKLENAHRMMMLGIARSRYLRSNGFKGDVNAQASAVPLDGMPRVIQQRTEMLQRQMLEQGVPPAQIRPAVQARLKQEFGI